MFVTSKNQMSLVPGIDLEHTSTYLDNYAVVDSFCDKVIMYQPVVRARSRLEFLLSTQLCKGMR